MSDRPITTLFMLMSADGKISTGSTDELDVDKDFLNIKGVKEGLHQYYEIELTTDIWSLNSGRVLAKIGANEKDEVPKTPVSFVVIDNNHLNERGVRYMCSRSQNLVIVTSNQRHPAYKINSDNLYILQQDKLNLLSLLRYLKSDFNCKRITIQTGGTLNAIFLRRKLIDYADIVVAPIFVGGKDTSTLIDGPSILHTSQLSELSALKLIRCQVLKNSYLRLKYKVIS